MDPDEIFKPMTTSLAVLAFKGATSFITVHFLVDVIFRLAMHDEVEVTNYAAELGDCLPMNRAFKT